MEATDLLVLFASFTHLEWDSSQKLISDLSKKRFKGRST